MTGSATLAGTLALTFDPGTYAPGATYPILTATGGVSGTFGTVTQSGQNLGLLVPTLTYKAKAVDLGFRDRSAARFRGDAEPVRGGHGLQQASETATGGDLVTVLNALVFSSAAAAAGRRTRRWRVGRTPRCRR